MNKFTITILASLAFILTYIAIADPIIFTPVPNPFNNNNYTATLNIEQVANLWKAMGSDSELVLPPIATNSHIKCLTFILMEDGTAKVNIVFKQDSTEPKAVIK